MSPNQGSLGPRLPAAWPTAPCQAVYKGERNGKSQSLTQVHHPCGQGSWTHCECTWSQRKKGRSAIDPSQGTAPVGVLLDQRCSWLWSPLWSYSKEGSPFSGRSEFTRRMDTGHTSELLLGNHVETPSLWEKAGQVPSHPL